jgi:hypothetical protein
LERWIHPDKFFVSGLFFGSKTNIASLLNEMAKNFTFNATNMNKNSSRK